MPKRKPTWNATLDQFKRRGAAVRTLEGLLRVTNDIAEFTSLLHNERWEIELAYDRRQKPNRKRGPK